MAGKQARKQAASGASKGLGCLIVQQQRCVMPQAESAATQITPTHMHTNTHKNIHTHTCTHGHTHTHTHTHMHAYICTGSVVGYRVSSSRDRVNNAGMCEIDHNNAGVVM